MTWYDYATNSPNDNNRYYIVLIGTASTTPNRKSSNNNLSDFMVKQALNGYNNL